MPPNKPQTAQWKVEDIIHKDTEERLNALEAEGWTIFAVMPRTVVGVTIVAKK